MQDQELFLRIADDLGGRALARGVILDDDNQVLYATRDVYFSPNLFNRSANDRFLEDIKRLVCLAGPAREEPLDRLAFELGGDMYTFHVEDADNKHLYGVCENPMYHVYAHLEGPTKFIVFSMVHAQCPDPSTRYPPLLESVNKVAEEVNSPCSSRRGSAEAGSSGSED